jgi:hypothetical protein
MSPFVECVGCGGLKRPDSVRCPHCRRWFPRNATLRRVLALMGLGTLAACLPVSPQGEGTTTGGYYSTDAYGAPPLRDGGPGDSGPVTYGADAYGIPPFLEDAGSNRTPPDLRDGGDPD